MANSAEQDLALQKIKDGKNVLILASAGTGKSYTMNQIDNSDAVTVAPTGISALNVGGVTAHRAFGLPMGLPTIEDFLTTSRKVKDLFNVYSPVKRIKFSEFGMLRLDQLEVINSKLQTLRGNKLPFGGIQIIGEGDYSQVAPVVTSYEEKAYFEQYPSIFNFKSELFKFDIVEFTKVFRQSDEREIAMLNSIRLKDRYYKHALDTIVRESKPYVASPDVTVLTCYKQDAARYNRKYFKLLDTPVYEFDCKIENLIGQDEWKESAVPKKLQLRVGAKVMFKANDPDGQYVNGQKATVTHLTKNSVKVVKDDGIEVYVAPHTWSKYNYRTKFGLLEKEETSKFTQIPLVLSYSQTLHSVQGVTLDSAAIDIGRGCFASGQFYMGISRVRSLKELSFVRQPSYSDVILDREVKEFFRSIRNK